MLLTAKNCFKCHKGHLPEQSKKKLDSRRDSDNHARKIKCYACKESGHDATFCIAKKRILSESEREQQKLAAKADADFGFF